jgi:glycosyltransferase involved in cell wall biosynthesis
MPPAPEHRVLFLIGQLSGGGYERQLWYLLGALDRERLRPGVVVWQRREDEPYRERIAALGVPIHDLAATNRLARARELRRLVGRLQPEVLHSWSFYTTPLAAFACSTRRMILVANVRSDFAVERRRLGRIAALMATRAPRALLANSHFAAASIRHTRWPRPRRVAYLPNAVPLDDFPPTPPPPSDRLEVVGVGRLAAEKNWPLALRGLAAFAEHTDATWRFRLVGTGPEEASIRELVSELGLADRVELLGFRDDVPALLADSHVLLLTSHYEGAPNAVLEAMAAARPTIATPVGDVPAWLGDGDAGWTIPPDDPAALAERVHFIQQHLDTAAAAGARARTRIAREHTPAVVADCLLATYADLGWRP